MSAPGASQQLCASPARNASEAAGGASAAPLAAALESRNSALAEKERRPGQGGKCPLPPGGPVGLPRPALRLVTAFSPRAVGTAGSEVPACLSSHPLCPKTVPSSGCNP